MAHFIEENLRCGYLFQLSFWHGHRTCSVRYLTKLSFDSEDIARLEIQLETEGYWALSPGEQKFLLSVWKFDVAYSQLKSSAAAINDGIKLAAEDFALNNETGANKKILKHQELYLKKLREYPKDRVRQIIKPEVMELLNQKRNQ